MSLLELLSLGSELGFMSPGGLALFLYYPWPSSQLGFVPHNYI